ncbi:D-galactonate dehydratase family member CLOBOL_02770, partial [Geodia barretti]
VTIRDIKVILTEPDGIRLVIVKVETSEPGPLRGRMRHLHAATLPVKVAVENYLRPFLIGRNVSDIEDIWQSSYVSSYWRNGGVLNNALSGVDQALWDIKGKMAGMPVYDLLGGRAREAAAVYVHASGREPAEVADKVSAFMDQGFHHIRVQVDTPGYATYGTKGLEKKAETGKRYAHPPGIFEPKPYMNSALRLFELVRSQCGWDFEMLHDVHERIPAIDGVWFAKEVEQYRLFSSKTCFRRRTRTTSGWSVSYAHTFGDGRTVEQPARGDSHGQGPADRLHTDPRFRRWAGSHRAVSWLRWGRCSGCERRGTGRGTRRPSATPQT